MTCGTGSCGTNGYFGGNLYGGYGIGYGLGGCGLGGYGYGLGGCGLSYPWANYNGGCQTYVPGALNVERRCGSC